MSTSNAAKRPTGCLIMAVLFGLMFLLSLVAAAASGEAPGAMMVFALSVWSTFLPVALLPRKAAILSGAVITLGLGLMVGLMAFIVTAPGGGDGMGQLAALLVGVGCLVLVLIHAGATLARWLTGRGKP